MKAPAQSWRTAPQPRKRLSQMSDAEYAQWYWRTGGSLHGDTPYIDDADRERRRQNIGRGVARRHAGSAS